MKEKIDKCVVLNIHVKCDDDKCEYNKYDENYDAKYDNACRENKKEEACVEINVFVECNKKKY